MTSARSVRSKGTADHQWLTSSQLPWSGYTVLVISGRGRCPGCAAFMARRSRRLFPNLSSDATAFPTICPAPG